MSNETTGKVLELVVFTLKDGVTREQFLATEPGVSAWMAEQAGFLGHDLLHAEEAGQWVEVAWWRTMAEAKAAAELAMTSDHCAPMFALIDMERMLYLHAEPVAARVAAA